MIGNFFSNLGRGNVSGLSIAGLVAAAFPVSYTHLFQYLNKKDLYLHSIIYNMIYSMKKTLFKLEELPYPELSRFGLIPVSYTHLDVYKRQAARSILTLPSSTGTKSTATSA